MEARNKRIRKKLRDFEKEGKEKDEWIKSQEIALEFQRRKVKELM